MVNGVTTAPATSAMQGGGTLGGEKFRRGAPNGNVTPLRVVPQINDIMKSNKALYWGLLTQNKFLFVAGELLFNPGWGRGTDSGRGQGFLVSIWSPV